MRNGAKESSEREEVVFVWRKRRIPWEGSVIEEGEEEVNVI